jgi:hypothetical protein
MAAVTPAVESEPTPACDGLFPALPEIPAARTEEPAPLWSGAGLLDPHPDASQQPRYKIVERDTPRK